LRFLVLFDRHDLANMKSTREDLVDGHEPSAQLLLLAEFFGSVW